VALIAQWSTGQIARSGKCVDYVRLFSARQGTEVLSMRFYGGFSKSESGTGTNCPGAQ
jgi:hypothetical protein